MYNNGYSPSNLPFKGKKMPKSKEKSCDYYVKLVFFFSSLIQSLIIVSLVLFLVYGQPQQTVEEKRVQELENSFSKLSLENVALRAKEKNLTQVLNVTLTAKIFFEKELTKSHQLANISADNIRFLHIKWSQCMVEKRTPLTAGCPPVYCPQNNRYLEQQLQQSQEMLKLIKTNCSERMNLIRLELDKAIKDRVRHHLEAIELRRDKTLLQERIEIYEKKCKEDFVQSLQGIPNVTREFLKRVDEVFSMKHFTFQLTCDKQRNLLEDIRANCSNLSVDMENKLQTYLDRVGAQVTAAVGASAKYMTENKRLTEDATWCKSNRSAIIDANQKALKQVQLKFEQEIEQLLLEVRKLTGHKKLQEDLLSVKEIEIKMLHDNVKDLNASLTSCKSLPKTPYTPFGSVFEQNPYASIRPGNGGAWDSRSVPGVGASNGMGTMGTRFTTGMGSTGLGSVGQGTSLQSRTAGNSVGLNTMGLSSTGIGFPKPGLANTPTSGIGGTGMGSTGLSQPGAGWPNIGSTGTGVAGFGGTGSISAGSSVGSVGSSGTIAGRTGLGVGSTGPTGFGSSGPSGTGFNAVGSNTAGSSPFGGGRVPTDSQLTAQINQHLKELHQFAKIVKK